MQAYLNVLVVDDDGIDLWLPGLLISRYGFNVFEASNMNQIIYFVLEYKIDIVIFNPLLKFAPAIDVLERINLLSYEKKPLIVCYSWRHLTIGPNILSGHHFIDKPVKSARQLIKFIAVHFPNLVPLLESRGIRLDSRKF